MKKIFLLSFLAVFSFATAQAQTKKKAAPKKAASTAKPVEQAVVKETTPVVTVPKKPAKFKQDGFVFAKDTVAVVVEPIAYPVIKREDVVYAKRVWREVDFRDRANRVLASPKVNLLAVVFDAISKGELELHEIDDEAFLKHPVSSEKRGSGGKSYADTLFLGVNVNTNELNSVSNDFFAQSFKGLRIKEDWILDIRRGVFEPRIVGVAPIRLDTRQAINADGSAILGADGQPMPPSVTEQPVGWINFDELRPLLANTKIVNNENSNSGITFDDIFVRRLFYSNIIKEDNVNDLRIQDMTINGRPLTERERLLESEKIKKKIADFEQGLWEY